jgi:hypothetical protein
VSNSRRHAVVQIGEPYSTPGDVCATCSDPERGLWVPISQCPEAIDTYYAETPWEDREWNERMDAAARHTRSYRMATQ